MIPPLNLEDLRKFIRDTIREELAPNRSRQDRREAALLWAMKLHENRGSVTTDTIIKAAKAFEDYVYGEES